MNKLDENECRTCGLAALKELKEERSCFTFTVYTWDIRGKNTFTLAENQKHFESIMFSVLNMDKGRRVF